jgi:hypothetical protein
MTPLTARSSAECFFTHPMYRASCPSALSGTALQRRLEHDEPLDPEMAGIYRRKVSELAKALEHPDVRPQALKPSVDSLKPSC